MHDSTKFNRVPVCINHSYIQDKKNPQRDENSNVPIKIYAPVTSLFINLNFSKNKIQR